MRAGVVITAAVAVTVTALVAGAAPAWAGDGYGQDNYAAAQASGGQLTVQAGLTDRDVELQESLYLAALLLSTVTGRPIDEVDDFQIGGA
ncbi:MAG: hypothetical protein M0Z30_21235 [Actinomycetota bacterium]|nr:hypothetical protein [Actinomycetota bacterium]